MLPPHVPHDPSAPHIVPPAQVWPAATQVEAPLLPATQQPPVHVLPGQQGAPGVPHFRQVVVEKVLGVPLQTVSASVQALPLTQQACCSLPQAQVPCVQVPYGVDVHISPAMRHSPPLQQPSPSHLLPGQQGAWGAPHLRQVLLASQTAPASVHTLPAQQGLPTTPHLVQTWVAEQTMSVPSHAFMPGVLVDPVVTGQQGCPA